MSVVAWHAASRTLAADSQLNAGTARSKGVKMRRGKHGALLAWVGDQAIGQGMARWFDGGAVVEDFPACECGGIAADGTELIVVLADGTCWTYEHVPEPIRVLEPMAAWGSGGSVALGALLAGKTPREACEIACSVDTACGMGIRVLTLAARPARGRKPRGGLGSQEAA